MKSFIQPTFWLSLCVSSLLQGQTGYRVSKPFGYTSIELPANRYSYIALTVQKPVVLQDTITAADASSVTVSGKDFVALLGEPDPSRITYILELADGTIQEIVRWDSQGKLITPDNITSKINGQTTQFSLRKASTIADLFGAENQVGLGYDKGDQANVDMIYVPGANGAVTGIYYYDDGDINGWFDLNGNDVGSFPIVYSDGFYIKRGAGAPLKLVTTGHVKLAATSGMLISGYNYVSSVSPVGLTLESSGLKSILSPDTTGNYMASNVDNIQIPRPNGSFLIAYYYNDGDPDIMGWYDHEGNRVDDVPLEGCFLILNRGGSKPYTLPVPEKLLQTGR